MRTNVSESVRPWPARLPLLAGAALLVATLDMALAMGFWSAHGVAPERVLQSVASGLAGRAAFAGGVATAVLGLALHLSIALAMVLAYDAIALRLPWLVRRPWLAGPLYGGVLYLVMTGIVLPLSAAPHATPSTAWLAASVFSHVVLVGLPCALLVRAAQATGGPRRWTGGGAGCVLSSVAGKLALSIRPEVAPCRAGRAAHTRRTVPDGAPAMPAISSATALPRRGLAMPWLLLGGYAAAALDLLAAMAYWVPRGIAPGRIPQSIAAWLLGPEAFAGGVSTAVFGALLYGQLLWGVTMLYHAIARRHPLLLRRPLACGALYGILAYVAIFQLVAPLCFGARPVHDLVWTATCVLVYATLVGMPCALFSRAALTTARPA